MAKHHSLSLEFRADFAQVETLPNGELIVIVGMDADGADDLPRVMERIRQIQARFAQMQTEFERSPLKGE